MMSTFDPRELSARSDALETERAAGYLLREHVQKLDARIDELAGRNAALETQARKHHEQLSAYQRDVVELRKQVTKLDDELEKLKKQTRRDEAVARITELERMVTYYRDRESGLANEVAYVRSQLQTYRSQVSLAPEDLDKLKRNAEIWQERALACGWTDMQKPRTDLENKLRAEHPEWSDDQVDSQVDVILRFKQLEL